MNTRGYSPLDHFINHIDQGIRTVFAQAIPTRNNPAQKTTEARLSVQDARQSAALMRVNHAGEVSAQALYHAQALTAKSPAVKKAMEQAAIEENDHLAWCEQRLQELNNHTSYLNPLWYAGSFAMGVCAGWAGDQWNLGFLAETERQVVKHLDQHLEQLSKADKKSRQILTKMREDEAHHATTASTAGAAELPTPIKLMMRGFSKVMTRVAYWI
jgi:ubiquinone biosynthesis monooxygenase Coq7